MAISSIHIENGKPGFFAHNSRESRTVNAIFSDEKNYCSCTKKEAFEIFRHELEKRSAKYTERTRQKLQKKAVTHLSAIVNLNQNHTEQDLQKVAFYLESTFDTKVIQMSIHRDEGHIDPNGNAIKNYHAHIEFMGLDSKGYSITRKLDRKALINLQTKVAELLGMERGTNYTLEKKKRPKRLGTYEYKKAKADEQKAVLVTQNHLKKINAELRKELQQANAVRADYAELEQLNRELKEQVKNKELTIENLEFKIESWRKSNRAMQGRVQELEQENKELKKDVWSKYNDRETRRPLKNSEMVERLFNKDEKRIKQIDNLQAQIIRLQAEIESLEKALRTAKKEVKTVIQEKVVVQEKIIEVPIPVEKVVVQEKIAENPVNMELKKENQKLKAENWSLRTRLRRAISNMFKFKIFQDIKLGVEKLALEDWDYEVENRVKLETEHDREMRKWDLEELKRETAFENDEIINDLKEGQIFGKSTLDLELFNRPSIFDEPKEDEEKQHHHYQEINLNLLR